MLTIEKIDGREAFDALLAREGQNWKLENFPWGSTPMDVRARVCHDGESLYVSMRCYEREPRATVTEHEGAVHLDSCMEFFFSPVPELREDYFNMEANPNGAMKFNYGPGRHGRVKTEKLPELAGMRASRTDEYWQLDYRIPFSLVRSRRSLRARPARRSARICTAAASRRKRPRSSRFSPSGRKSPITTGRSISAGWSLHKNEMMRGGRFRCPPRRVLLYD